MLLSLLHFSSAPPPLPPGGKRYPCTGQRQAEEEGEAGQQEALLPELSDDAWPPPQEIPEQCLLLGQRGHGQQEAGELAAVAHQVERAGREALGDGTAGEEGRQQGQRHLVGAEGDMVKIVVF